MYVPEIFRKTLITFCCLLLRERDYQQVASWTVTQDNTACVLLMQITKLAAIKFKRWTEKVKKQKQNRNSLSMGMLPIMWFVLLSAILMQVFVWFLYEETASEHMRSYARARAYEHVCVREWVHMRARVTVHAAQTFSSFKELQVYCLCCTLLCTFACCTLYIRPNIVPQSENF